MPLEPWDEGGTRLDFDMKVLEKCLFALNISRHNVAAYPAEHPAVAQSVEKFLELLGQLLEFQDSITLAAARNRLMVGGAVLDEKNAVYRSLATVLFEAGLSAVTLTMEVTSDEVILWLQALRRTANAGDDLAQTLAAAKVRGIRVHGFDFSGLHATDLDTVPAPDKKPQKDNHGLMWESFTEALLENTLDPRGSEFPGIDEVDPAILADLMSHVTQRSPAESEPNYENTIITFLRNADQESIDNETRKDFLDKLSVFIDKLTPGTRRHFLGSAFRYLGQRQDLTEEVLTRLSSDTVLGVLDDLGYDQIKVPPLVLELLGKLGQCGGQPDSTRLVAPPKERSQAEVAAGVREIFQRPETERFVPGSYFKLLQGLLGTRRLTGQPQESIDQLLATLDNRNMENRLCEIILEIIDTDPHASETSALEGNLRDLVEYFLQMGDFAALIRTYERLDRHDQEADAFAFPLAQEALEVFRTPEFMGQILEGFTLWERERHDDIRTLIRLVGEPFADPLLERLAEEPGLSGRKLYMACLEDLGAAAHKKIIARLHDPRWYVTRNLVVLLRQSNDRQVLKPLVHLIGHPHPKVQFEVMKTFVAFGDPRAERYLLRELNAEQLERRLNAVLLARSGATPKVLEEMGKLLQEGLSEADLELKIKAVQALAESHLTEAAAAVAGVLRSKNLLRPLLLRRLKEEALRATSRHRPPWAEELLRQTAASSGATAKLAGSLLAAMKEAVNDR